MGYTDKPEISILNHSHGETVCYPLVLLEGKILEKWKNTNAVDVRRHLTPSSMGTSSEVELDRASKLQVLGPDSECEHTVGQNEMEASNLQVECGNSLTTCAVISGGFKTVVPLSVGENNIKLSCSNGGVNDLNFQMTYAPLETSRFVRVVYVLCADSDGSFDAPAEVANDINAAVKRLSFNARLLQTFMAESLYQHGMGHKTFRLEEDNSGSPKVHIFTSSLTTDEALKMTGDQLYQMFSEELNNSSLHNPLCKLWTFMSCTHYDPPPQEMFDDKLITKYVKAHTALGGGQLALFGTGGLHTWACDVEQLVPCFTDVQMINKHSLFDDSGGRGFYWANYATGLGASMHELGHCFDLAHTPKGIMGRGFDDMNCVFTMWKIPPSGNTSAANEESGLQEEGISGGVERLGEATEIAAAQASTPASTHVGGLVPTTAESGPNQLSLKHSIIAMPNEWSHGAHWYRSSAVLLRYHKWLSDSDATNDDVIDNPIVHWCRRVFGPVGNGGGCHQKNQTMFSTQSWLKSQSATLAGFVVYAGKYVNCIQTMGNVEKSDNGECVEILSEPSGEVGLGKCYNFVISSPDEYITGVDVRAGGWIDAIRLHTNWKSSVWMGGTGGDEYHLRPPFGRKVLGLFGTSGKFVGSLGLLLNSEDETAISEGSGNDDDSLFVHAPLGVRLVELWDAKHSEVYQHWEFLDCHPPKSFTVSRADVKDKASTLLVEDDRGNIFLTGLVYDYGSIV